MTSKRTHQKRGRRYVHKQADRLRQQAQRMHHEPDDQADDDDQEWINALRGSGNERLGR